MRTSAHLRLLAAVLIVTGIVAFAPQLQRPHFHFSIRSSATTLSGAKRFVDNSAHLPDLKVSCPEQRVPLPEYLEQTSDDSGSRQLTISKFAALPLQPLIRRFTLRPARADSPVPL
jgi:hypothetical protein